MENFKLEEHDRVEFKSFNQLSYENKGNMVELYVDNNYVGDIEVFRDSEMENREYICVNYQIVYLNTIIDNEAFQVEQATLNCDLEKHFGERYNKLPPSRLYSKLLYKATIKFNINMETARDRYGLFTLKQWCELFS